MRSAISTACSTLVASAVGRLLHVELARQLLEALAVLRAVDRLHRVPRIGTPSAPAARQLERRLPAELHDHPLRLLQAHDLQHVLQRQRLEVELVGDVEVGRDGLRVGVDHDGLPPGLAQRERRLHAAVVELHPLPDPVGAAPQDHDLAAVRALRLVLLGVGGVQVRRLRRELARAGVHHVVDGVEPQPPSALAHLVLRLAAQTGELHVGEAEALHPRSVVAGRRRPARRSALRLDQLRELRDEPDDRCP
jgi:hypothetical protein